jgi:hypothetical protein
MVLRKAALTTAAVLLLLGSCADDEGMEEQDEVGDSNGDAAPKTSLQVNIEGSNIEAGAQEVEVPAPARICLSVESDRKAKLHVHSIPDQTLTFGAGAGRGCFTIDTPWLLAEVEDHESGQSVVKIVTIAK